MNNGAKILAEGVTPIVYVRDFAEAFLHSFEKVPSGGVASPFPRSSDWPMEWCASDSPNSPVALTPSKLRLISNNGPI